MIASEYIWKNLSKYETVAAEIYVTEMEAEGVRTCNDGFPDARSPLTNPYKIRIRIAALRQAYGRAYPHTMYVRNWEAKSGKSFEDGYNKALDDVGNSLSECAIATKGNVRRNIANLRKMLRS